MKHQEFQSHATSGRRNSSQIVSLVSPMTMNMMTTNYTLNTIYVNYFFKGVTSHFWNPRLGRRQSLKIGEHLYIIPTSCMKNVSNSFSLLLACRQFDGFHGGTEIGVKLFEIMREFEILGRVWILVSDSAQNMIKGWKSTYV